MALTTYSSEIKAVINLNPQGANARSLLFLFLYVLFYLDGKGPKIPIASGQGDQFDANKRTYYANDITESLARGDYKARCPI